MAMAGDCDVEEAWHGCPSGPYSCWQAEESQSKHSATGHIGSTRYYFILGTPWCRSVLGQVAHSMPEPRPGQERAGSMRSLFFGDRREPRHMATHPQARLVEIEAPSAFHLMPVCVSSPDAVPWQSFCPFPVPSSLQATAPGACRNSG